jgi:hypothetical protein
MKKLVYRNLSILAPKHGTIADRLSLWPLNMIPCCLFQPEDDSGWSCGPFTNVKVLETLLQLERNGKTKFLGNRAQFRLETESWKVLKRQVVGQQQIEQTI